MAYGISKPFGDAQGRGAVGMSAERDWSPFGGNPNRNAGLPQNPQQALDATNWRSPFTRNPNGSTTTQVMHGDRNVGAVSYGGVGANPRHSSGSATDRYNMQRFGHPRGLDAAMRQKAQQSLGVRNQSLPTTPEQALIPGTGGPLLPPGGGGRGGSSWGATIPSWARRGAGTVFGGARGGGVIPSNGGWRGGPMVKGPPSVNPDGFMGALLQGPSSLGIAPHGSMPSPFVR